MADYDKLNAALVRIAVRSFVEGWLARPSIAMFRMKDLFAAWFRTAAYQWLKEAGAYTAEPAVAEFRVVAFELFAEMPRYTVFEDAYRAMEPGSDD